MDEVLIDARPFANVYQSGRVERLIGNDVLPAGLDPATGVASKDVLVDPATNLTARLYLPDPACCPPERKLPVLVYFHGGGFVVDTAASPMYHNYLNSLVAAAGVVAVSVDYRRAPEHPLPAAYDDSWAVLRWVASRPADEWWIAERGDVRRVFLAGDSAGANIAHQVALRAAAEGLGGEAAIAGVVLVHPFFWGPEPFESDSREATAREWVGRVWPFACSGAAGLEDPWINPQEEGLAMARLPCRGVLVAVAVAGKDMLREKQIGYYEALRRSGWVGEARLVEAEGEEHVFHLENPEREQALAMLQDVAAFLISYC